MKDQKKMSLSEYFTHRGLKEARRIEVTYEDGSKVAIEGNVALMWWRLVHLLWRDMDNVRHEDVYMFRPVDKDGKLPPYTLKEMIEIHDWSTGICSFPGHMRNTSPTYKDIVNQGEAALPAILEYLQEKGGGMNIILLLEDISHALAYEPETIVQGALVGYNVEKCVKAWVNWGKKKKYIK